MLSQHAIFYHQVQLRFYLASCLLILLVCVPNLANSCQTTFIFSTTTFTVTLLISSSPKSFPVVFLLPNVLFTLEGTLCYMTFSCFFKAPGSNRITQYQMTFCTDFAVKAQVVGCQKQSLLQLFSLCTSFSAQQTMAFRIMMPYINGDKREITK